MRLVHCRYSRQPVHVEVGQTKIFSTTWRMSAYLKCEIGVEPHSWSWSIVSTVPTHQTTRPLGTYARATGRLVKAPKTNVAMPARAAVAVIRSLRSSKCLNQPSKFSLLKEFSRDWLPSLHATKDLISSQAFLSTRSHSQIPPVWKRIEACLVNQHRKMRMVLL